MPQNNKENFSNQSEFINYIVSCHLDGISEIPSLSQLSKELGISVSSIREQMEVARSLGLIDVKTRTGIKILDFNFSHSIFQAVDYSIKIKPQNFLHFSDLRRHIEASYWFEAANKLTNRDIQKLRVIVNDALKKLSNDPPFSPQNEHKDFHTSIFKRLNNPYVMGILEAYWQLYESVGLSYYTDRNYLTQVWQSHQQIVEALEVNDLNTGYQVLLSHMDLLNIRVKKDTKSVFE